MSEEKKPNRITAHYATDEDYERMNFYTIGTLYRAEHIMAHRQSGLIDHTLGDPSARGLPKVDNLNESAEG